MTLLHTIIRVTCFISRAIDSFVYYCKGMMFFVWNSMCFTWISMYFTSNSMDFDVLYIELNGFRCKVHRIRQKEHRIAHINGDACISNEKSQCCIFMTFLISLLLKGGSLSEFDLMFSMLFSVRCTLRRNILLNVFDVMYIEFSE